jgi:glycerol-3-phosphate acyltransferase PlsY
MEFITNINIIFYLIAYLVGSIPFGLLIAKYFAGVDVLSDGSKSIGATNVLRTVKKNNPTLAKKLGIATLLLDGIKGVLVILVAKYLGLSLETQWTIAVLAVIGHCYSVFLLFNGGKGIATGYGVLMLLMPIEASLSIIVWGIFIYFTKISSLSSMAALASIIIFSLIFQTAYEQIESYFPIYIIAFIVAYKHIPNLARLISGQETKSI